MSGFRDLTLYVIRHGETEDNLAGRWTGTNDSPLTLRGREHARSSGQILKRVAADLEALEFVTSPLHRASMTMRLLREGAGLPQLGYRADRRLRENDCGDWTGFTEDELRAMDPEHLALRDDGEWTWKAPGGESLAEQFPAVGAFLATLTRDSVIVCHGFTSRLVRAHLLALEPDDAVRLGMLPNSGIMLFHDGKESFFSA